MPEPVSSSPASERPPRTVWVLRPTMGEGGADRVTLTLLRHLDRRLFRLTLVLMRAQGPWLAEVPADVERLELGGNFPGGGRLWTAWRPLARLLRRRPPDILFSTSGGTNLIAALAIPAAAGRTRLVLSERSMLRRPGQPLKRRALLLAKRLLYGRADAVTAVSAEVAADLVERLRLDPRRVRVVYNPLATPELEGLAAAEPEHPWFGGAPGRAPGPPVVLGVGRLLPVKGFDLLIAAFARVRARRPARLVVFGEGPARGALERLVCRRGLDDCVSLPGFDPNPFRYMSRCALFVLSSHSEGLPGALIQAMACGAPVVATDCPGGPAEVVTDGADGLLVPAGDEAALAAAIERLLGDPELARRLGRRAIDSAARFSLPTVLGSYEAALLGEPAAQAATGAAPEGATEAG